MNTYYEETPGLAQVFYPFLMSSYLGSISPSSLSALLFFSILLTLGWKIPTPIEFIRCKPQLPYVLFGSFHISLAISSFFWFYKVVHPADSFPPDDAYRMFRLSYTVISHFCLLNTSHSRLLGYPTRRTRYHTNSIRLNFSYSDHGNECLRSSFSTTKNSAPYSTNTTWH